MKKNWGADISLSTQHQEFEIVSADMSSIDFSPRMTLGDLTISASLPWLNVDGDYFVNGGLPRVVDFCQRLDGLSPQMLQRLIRRGRISETQINRCDNLNEAITEQEKSQSGLGDISIDLEYRHYWNKANSGWTAISAGYKHDNGDLDSSVGSGSRDSSLGLALGYDGVTWFSHIDYNYTFVSPTGTPYAVNDYSGVALGVGVNLGECLVLGVDYHREEAYWDDADEVNYVTGFIDWSISNSWSLGINLSDYDQAAEYPKTEYGLHISYSF